MKLFAPRDFRPVKDMVLVIPYKKGESMSTGAHGKKLVLPESVEQNAYRLGLVIAVGGGPVSGTTGTRLPMDVEVGDIVAYHVRTGWHFRLEATDGRVIKEQDVFAVVGHEDPEPSIEPA